MNGHPANHALHQPGSRAVARRHVNASVRRRVAYMPRVVVTGGPGAGEFTVSFSSGTGRAAMYCTRYLGCQLPSVRRSFFECSHRAPPDRSLHTARYSGLHPLPKLQAGESVTARSVDVRKDRWIEPSRCNRDRCQTAV